MYSSTLRTEMSISFLLIREIKTLESEKTLICWTPSVDAVRMAAFTAKTSAIRAEVTNRRFDWNGSGSAAPGRWRSHPVVFQTFFPDSVRVDCPNMSTWRRGVMREQDIWNKMSMMDQWVRFNRGNILGSLPSFSIVNDFEDCVFSSEVFILKEKFVTVSPQGPKESWI